jgi:hypothetical protein
MKYAVLSVVFLLTSFSAFGILGVGDKAPNYCWKDVDDNKLCLEDMCHVRVLLYNTGWCGPCNNEFKSLAAATAEFSGKPVTFISLSAAGWTSGSTPDRKFLQEWQTKHKLNLALANILVAGSPHDAGKDFFSSPSIPNVVIVDPAGEVAWKAIGPDFRDVLAEVRKILPVPLPIPIKEGMACRKPRKHSKRKF